jgi:hypothetical protein
MFESILRNVLHVFFSAYIVGKSEKGEGNLSDSAKGQDTLVSSVICCPF